MTITNQYGEVYQGDGRNIEFDATQHGGGLTGGTGLHLIMQRSATDVTDQIYKTGTVVDDNTARFTMTGAEYAALTISGTSANNPGLADTFYLVAKYVSTSGKPVTLGSGEIDIFRLNTRSVSVTVELGVMSVEIAILDLAAVVTS